MDLALTEAYHNYEISLYRVINNLKHDKRCNIDNLGINIPWQLPR